ncbi:MAG TPA: hypothetical protein VM328_12110 [Fimbriimonadaceae bacterium]|nr:hypothetical protein [Fimbriimonadaceae bacterium]
MGYGYDAICKGCGANFEVNEGSEMVAMPFHCERCGRNVVEVRTRRPRWKRAERPALRLRGGAFSADAPARCAKCGSADFDRDPDGMSMIYD